jgi:hypothetical protein
MSRRREKPARALKLKTRVKAGDGESRNIEFEMIKNEIQK